MKMKELGELEQQAMDIIWSCQACFVLDVVAKLRQKRHILAYTTVATILQRLFDKGLLTRKSQGKSYLYSPKVTKEIYSKNIIRSYVNKFLDTFGDVAVASFANSIDTLPYKKRQYLLKLLQHK